MRSQGSISMVVLLLFCASRPYLFDRLFHAQRLRFCCQRCQMAASAVGMDAGPTQSQSIGKRRMLMHVLNKGSLVLLTVLIVTFAHESQIKWTLLFAAALVLEFMGGLFAQARRTHSFFHRSFDRCALNFPIALICFWAGFDSTECYFKPVWHSQVVAITAGCLSTVTSGLAALDIDYFANSGVARDIDTSAVYTLIHFLLRTTEVATRVITLTVLCIVLRLLISESGLESALPNMLTSLLVCCPIIFLWGLNVSILRWSSNISGMPKDGQSACNVIFVASAPVLCNVQACTYTRTPTVAHGRHEEHLRGHAERHRHGENPTACWRPCLGPKPRNIRPPRTTKGQPNLLGIRL